VTEKVATPVLSVVADAGVITELPPDALRDTVFPATGAPGRAPWSRRVTVIVEAVVPSLGTEMGLATTLEFAGVTTGAANVTLTGVVSVTVSVVSSAVYVTASGVVSVTLKIAVPSAAEVADVGVMTELPLWAVSVTVFPGTGTELESRRRTVMMSGSLPSATGDGGTAAAVTVEVLGSAPVGGGGALPSPGLAPLSPAVGVTKKG
jgi:hypothetical protein